MLSTSVRVRNTSAPHPSIASDSLHLNSDRTLLCKFESIADEVHKDSLHCFLIAPSSPAAALQFCCC
jgi:hypothetical protein